MNIFVANLNFKLSNDELQDLFEQFGEVSSARIITDHESGRSRGFAFVEMPNDEEAEDAIATLNETDFGGRTIVVKEARPRDNRGGGGGGYGRGGGDRGGDRWGNSGGGRGRY